METALRTGNLVLPEGFVEMDREEMMYVDGGFYITNNQLWLVLQACALNPIGATLIGLGIYKLAAWITALGAKFGAKIGGLIGGLIGSLIGTLIGAAALGSVALTYASALIQGKGIDVSLKYTWFGVPYWVDISVK